MPETRGQRHDTAFLLFVPGDSERKLAKAETTQADALVLDLEDAVAPENIDRARAMVKEYLASRRPRGRQQLWVRINPIQTPKALADLAAVMPGAPMGSCCPSRTRQRKRLRSAITSARSKRARAGS